MMEQWTLSRVPGRRPRGDDGDLSNTRLMRYAASFYAWSGHDGALFYRPDGAVDPWASDWTISIGDPTGPRIAVGGAWRRDFTGVAVVNPSTVPQDVPLEGTFLTPKGTPISTIHLPPGRRRATGSDFDSHCRSRSRKVSNQPAGSRRAPGSTFSRSSGFTFSAHRQAERQGGRHPVGSTPGPS